MISSESTEELFVSDYLELTSQFLRSLVTIDAHSIFFHEQ